MNAKKIIKNATYWRLVFEAEAGALRDCRRDLDVARNKIHVLVNDAAQLREVVMNMKKAMEFSINTSAALLDAMGELVDNVSGRKARRERNQELDLSHIEDPTR